MHALEPMTRAIELIRHVACGAQPPVEPVAPRVVRTDENAPAGVARSLGADARAAMTTDIQQRAYLAVLSANYEERLATQARGEEVARFAPLTVVSDAMPVAEDQLPNLALEELLVAVEVATERVTRALSGDCLRTAMSILSRLARHRRCRPC